MIRPLDAQAPQRRRWEKGLAGRKIDAVASEIGAIAERKRAGDRFAAIVPQSTAGEGAVGTWARPAAESPAKQRAARVVERIFPSKRKPLVYEGGGRDVQRMPKIIYICL